MYITSLLKTLWRLPEIQWNPVFTTLHMTRHSNTLTSPVLFLTTFEHSSRAPISLIAVLTTQMHPVSESLCLQFPLLDILFFQYLCPISYCQLSPPKRLSWSLYLHLLLTLLLFAHCPYYSLTEIVLYKNHQQGLYSIHMPSSPILQQCLDCKSHVKWVLTNFGFINGSLY